MRARVVIALLFVATFVFAEERPRFIVRGTVSLDAQPLSGCVVTLKSEDASLLAITSDVGEFALSGVLPDVYQMNAEIAGVSTFSTFVAVEGDTTIEPIELQRDVVTVRTFCGGPPCGERSDDPYDAASCADYQYDSVLIAKARENDRGAIALLERRHDSVRSLQERHRIAAALLRRVPNDAIYWRELDEAATDAIRYAYIDEQPTPSYAAFCLAHGVDVDMHRAVLLNALAEASMDDRATPLLWRALKTKDAVLVDLAKMAFKAREQPDKQSQ